MSSVHGRPEARWGGAGKQLKGCVCTTRTQPGRPAALLHPPPPSSPASCPQQLCPQPLCCGTHLLVEYPQVPSSTRIISAQRDSPGTGCGAGAGTCKGGGGKATLIQQCGFLTLGFALIEVDTRTAPSPENSSGYSREPQSNLQLPASALAEEFCNL